MYHAALCYSSQPRIQGPRYTRQTSTRKQIPEITRSTRDRLARCNASNKGTEKQDCGVLCGVVWQGDNSTQTHHQQSSDRQTVHKCTGLILAHTRRLIIPTYTCTFPRIQVSTTLHLACLVIHPLPRVLSTCIQPTNTPHLYLGPDCNTPT